MKIGIVRRPLDQVSFDQVPDADRGLVVLRIEAHHLADPGRVVARELLVPVGLSLVGTADDLDAEVRRAALPDLPHSEGAVGLAQADEDVRREALLRGRRVPVHELIGADRRRGAQRLLQAEVERGPALQVLVRLGHFFALGKV